MNPLHLRNWIKRLINATTRRIMRVVPELEKTTKIAKLTDEVFVQLQRNTSHQPKRYYKDKNFTRLLETARKTLILLIETDNHYEKWVGYFYIQVMLKMNRLYEDFCVSGSPSSEFKEFADWFLETENYKE